MCEKAAVTLRVVDLTEMENKLLQKTGAGLCRQRCDTDSMEQETFAGRMTTAVTDEDYEEITVTQMDAALCPSFHSASLGFTRPLTRNGISRQLIFSNVSSTFDTKELGHVSNTLYTIRFYISSVR